MGVGFVEGFIFVFESDVFVDSAFQPLEILFERRGSGPVFALAVDFLFCAVEGFLKVVEVVFHGKCVCLRWLFFRFRRGRKITCCQTATCVKCNPFMFATKLRRKRGRFLGSYEQKINALN